MISIELLSLKLSENKSYEDCVDLILNFIFKNLAKKY